MNNSTSIYKKVLSILGDENRIKTGEPLSAHTTFRVGGPADLMVMPATKEEIIKLIDLFQTENIKYIILGNGSNVLVSDAGYRGAVIQIGNAMSYVNREDKKITAGAGTILSAVSSEAAKASLTGMEFASGIPGSIGGAVFMNAGAYGGEMSQVVTAVTAVLPDGSVKRFTKDEGFDFGYRHSVFCDNGAVIVEVEVELKPGVSEEIYAYTKELTRRRVEKQPLSFPSAGSTFKRPEGHFAGKLIEDSGCKGLSVGGALVSPKHAGFIVNNGGATAKDILNLIKLVQMRVKDEFGVDMETEVRIIGE
ncbi:MAG: UDP-N-acetylmuramate dehydrogenase [Firmicutes bacterium]|nr:UDP-N-acetylmuramate dehydrogenase [Bacillota bacterium]